MKKWVIIWILIILCCISACSNKSIDNADSINGISDIADSHDAVDGDEEEIEVDAINRTIIAEALGVEEENRNIRFILNSLNTIGTGKVQSADATEIDGEKVINLIAEDGTEYRIYLSRRGSVEAIKNLDTGEWPVQSKR